ncbi:MAG: endolytic transglycosylase MltG [Actinobacteria bacterium]|nr:endolytic transglycosylase MltG [Actinomycetota bacterium]
MSSTNRDGKGRHSRPTRRSAPSSRQSTPDASAPTPSPEELDDRYDSFSEAYEDFDTTSLYPSDSEPLDAVSRYSNDPEDFDAAPRYHGDSDEFYAVKPSKAPSGSRKSLHSAAVGGGHYFRHDTQRTPKVTDDPKMRFISILAVSVLVVVLCVFGAVKVVNHFTATTTIEPGLSVTVTIPDGASTKTIASVLKDAGVIDNIDTFVAYIAEQEASTSLQPGTYSMVTGMDYETIKGILLSGPEFDGYILTIPEGYTLVETAARIEEVCGIPAVDFLAIAQTGAAGYAAEFPFLANAYNGSMEGYLFPKTYQIPKDSTADYVIRLLLNQFSVEVATVDMTYSAGRNLTIGDVVAIASMIERETSSDAERPLVASVIYNRLHEDMALQIDATVAYATGGEIDTEFDSPYNTYAVKGLPAGPICSPGLASLQAAANPEETVYLYYVASPALDGTHTFWETYDEFLVAKDQYKEAAGLD